MGLVPDDETLSRHDGVGAWGTITTISESSMVPGLIYVGTDDGRIQMSRDAAESWQSLEEGVRDFESRRAKVSRVVASSHAESRAYVTFDRHQLGDFSPYVFVTDDSGESFRSITGGLPETGWVNVLVEHPRNPDLLFIGTEIGLFVTFDRGTHWERMTANFPTVPVDDLVIHSRDGDLVVGTHGRAIYILDDVTPLAEHAASGSDVELFPVREATVYLPWKHESYRAQRQFVGENPPFDAIITYFVPEAGDDVTVEVTGGAGESIAELEGAGTRGFHRLVWDLRSRAPEELNGEHGPLVSPVVTPCAFEGEISPGSLTCTFLWIHGWTSRRRSRAPATSS